MGLLGSFADAGCRVSGLAEMTAVGLGLPAETFSSGGKYGFVHNITDKPP